MKLCKLLLVEDSEEAAQLLISVLEYAGHKVVHKTLGLEGLKASSEKLFDGIFLDYMLPDINGLELCSMMRKSLKHTPIFLTTGYVDKITPLMMSEAGFTAALPKPCSLTIVEFVKKNVKTRSLLKAEQKKPEGFLRSILGNLYVD
jgi:CheY-like chemotaxis protein